MQNQYLNYIGPIVKKYVGTYRNVKQKMGTDILNIIVYQKNLIEF